MASGIVDSSLGFHLQKAKANGISRDEIAEVLTHLAFYTGWPKAWAVFRMAREIWDQGDVEIGVTPAQAGVQVFGAQTGSRPTPG